jgi:hypothetical protein
LTFVGANPIRRVSNHRVNFAERRQDLQAVAQYQPGVSDYLLSHNNFPCMIKV